ncbi:MAG: threonylcarbamoyl-AMP synthase [Clostridia bacterium]|nr:threonylcarbamoyl-AMP synthase [Clostridia bacterium]
MDTKIARIIDTTEYGNTLDEAAKIILSGGLVVFPTETVYGLGGNGLLADAAKKIYSAKGRPSDNPLIIHIAEPKDAENYAFTGDIYYRLAESFMPGPLTVIMKKRDCIPHSVTGGLDTVAVRCPSHPVAHALIEKCGVPIAAPSANISGRPSPTSAEYVIEDMNGRVEMIIDGGECEIGLESTIVKIDGNSLTLLRPGAITYDALCCVCEDVKIAPAVLEKLAENEKPLSPGMKYRHYAPNADFVLLDGDDSDVLEFIKKEQVENNCAVLCYDEELSHLDASLSICIGAKEDLNTQAKKLFTALREADKLGANKIYAHLPTLDGLGLALYNRMIRAAAHTIKKV